MDKVGINEMDMQFYRLNLYDRVFYIIEKIKEMEEDGLVKMMQDAHDVGISLDDSLGEDSRVESNEPPEKFDASREAIRSLWKFKKILHDSNTRRKTEFNR